MSSFCDCEEQLVQTYLSQLLISWPPSEDHRPLTLFERSIRSARNTDLWGQGVNLIGSSILTSEELSSIVARLIVKIMPRYDLS